MSEEFGGDLITMSDEDGNEFVLEHLDTLEHNGFTYMAFVSAEENGSDDENENFELSEEDGIIILKLIESDGDEILSTLDDDDELDKVYELFMEQLLEDEE